MKVEKIEKLSRSDSMGFQVEYILHLANGQIISVITQKQHWTGQEFDPEVSLDDLVLLEHLTETIRVNDEFLEFPNLENIFRYTDYYDAFKGKCPECGEEIVIDPPDESTSDAVVYPVCPVCGKQFKAQLKW